MKPVKNEKLDKRAAALRDNLKKRKEAAKSKASTPEKEPKKP
jgi:hypothetical protein